MLITFNFINQYCVLTSDKKLLRKKINFVFFWLDRFDEDFVNFKIILLNVVFFQINQFNMTYMSVKIKFL